MTGKERAFLRRMLESVTHPVAPDTEIDPWKMEPGDCQRALARLWEMTE